MTTKAPGDYSQCGEQPIIEAYFAKHPPRWRGRLLDIGAHDGRSNSNTHALLTKHGWNGVLVEPSPRVFASLMETYKGRDDISLICAAAIAGTGIVALQDSGGDQVSTVVESHAQQWAAQAGVRFQKIWVGTVSLFELKTWGPYDFISIDAEGLSFRLLTYLLGSFHHPVCICVEKEGEKGVMEGLLKQHGYGKIIETRENYVAFLEG